MKKLFKLRNLFLIFTLAIFVIEYIVPIKTKDFGGNDFEKLIKNPTSVREDLDILKVSVLPSTNSLNPFFDNYRGVSLVSRLLNSSLISKDRKNIIEKDIAKDYWYENEGKTIAVKLRDDLFFSNGKKLTSIDVKNTYMVLADPSYDGVNSEYVDRISGYYEYKKKKTGDFGIEVVNDTFIKFHFSISDLTNINTLTFPVIYLDSEDVKYDEAYKLKDKKFVDGVGPYKVRSYNSLKIELELKDKYLDYAIKRIDIFENDYNFAIIDFKKGLIDIVYKYDKNSSIEALIDNRIRDYSYTIDNESNNFYMLGFGVNSNLFKDAEFRRALKNTIDFKKIIKNNIGENIYSFPNIPIFENSWFKDNNINDTSTVRLADLLSGKLDKKNGFYVLEGKKFTLKLAVSKSNEFFKKIKNAVIEEFKKEGINLEITELSDNKMFEVLNGEGEYDLFVTNRFMTEFPSVINEFKLSPNDEFLETDFTSSAIFYVLSKIDKDPNGVYIKNLTRRWQEAFVVNTPYIVLATSNKTTLINDRVKNVQLNEFVGLENLFNLKNIKIIGK